MPQEEIIDMTTIHSNNLINTPSTQISLNFHSHSKSFLKRQSEDDPSLVSELKFTQKKPRATGPSSNFNSSDKELPLPFSGTGLATIMPENAKNFAIRHHISTYNAELAFRLAQWKSDHARTESLPPLPLELKYFNKICKSPTASWSDLEILVNGIIIEINPNPINTPFAMCTYSSRARVMCAQTQDSILEKYRNG